MAIYYKLKEPYTGKNAQTVKACAEQIWYHNHGLVFFNLVLNHFSSCDLFRSLGRWADKKCPSPCLCSQNVIWISEKTQSEVCLVLQVYLSPIRSDFSGHSQMYRQINSWNFVFYEDIMRGIECFQVKDFKCFFLQHQNKGVYRSGKVGKMGKSWEYELGGKKLGKSNDFHFEVRNFQFEL